MYQFTIRSQITNTISSRLTTATISKATVQKATRPTRT